MENPYVEINQEQLFPESLRPRLCLGSLAPYSFFRCDNLNCVCMVVKHFSYGLTNVATPKGVFTMFSDDIVYHEPDLPF